MLDIRVDGATFVYPNGFCAVENLNLQINAGESVAIIGQNGAGKTTAVKLLNNLLKPTEGNVLIGEKNTHDFSTAQIAHDVGYVFQNPDDQLFLADVYAELAFAPKIRKLSEEATKTVMRFAADLTELHEYLAENPHDLPLSLRKFVTIGAVITMEPSIFIFDEPTAGQDKAGIERIQNIIRTLHAEGKTVITITHDMEFVADTFERVIVMANKRVICDDHPNSVFKRSEILQDAYLKAPIRYQITI